MAATAVIEMNLQIVTALPTGTSKCRGCLPWGATTSSNNDLASLFACSVCFDYVWPPVLQRQRSHQVCSNCYPKLTCCSNLVGPLGNHSQLGDGESGQFSTFPLKICLFRVSNNSAKQKKQTTKSSVSFGLTPACAPVLPVNGKALWMLWCPIGCISTSSAGRGYRFPHHRHQSHWGCGLGDDAVLLRLPIHAGLRETG